MHTLSKRVSWIVLIGGIALLGGLVYWLARPTPAPVATTPFRGELATDLLPLYSAVSWSIVKEERVAIGTTTYEGASVGSAPITGTMDPGSVFTPFENYYDKKLKALGWHIANELAAGGHTGGQTGYVKGTETALVRYHVDYHTVSETAPSECPCDVTLSLFSAP